MTANKVKFMTMNGYSLLNIRLWFYSLALLNLLVTAYVTLTIDLTVEEDPKVRAYSNIRWLLLTCWYNMATIFYISLCLYCDWRQKNEDQTPQLNQLMKIRDVIMTSVLFPVTVYSDFVFWTLYTSYPWIIAPARVLELMPYWAQHSVHTVSMVFVIMDLVLTPRQRPKSDKTNLALLYGVACFYTFAMYVSYVLGHSVYAFFDTAPRSVCIQSFVGSLLILTVCYYTQWFIVDYIWRQRTKKLCSDSENVKLK